MFMNRALQLTVVKKSDKTDTNNSTECSHVDHASDYAAIAMYHAEHLAKIVVVAVVANKLLNTASQIAIIAATAKIK